MCKVKDAIIPLHHCIRLCCQWFVWNSCVIWGFCKYLSQNMPWAIGYCLESSSCNCWFEWYIVYVYYYGWKLGWVESAVMHHSLCVCRKLRCLIISTIFILKIRLTIHILKQSCYYVDNIFQPTVNHVYVLKILYLYLKTLLQIRALYINHKQLCLVKHYVLIE